MSVMRSGRMRLSLIAVLVMLSSVARASDDVTFEASAPNTVVNGESFQLVYTLSNVSGKEPRLPEIDGFEIIGKKNIDKEITLETHLDHRLAMSYFVLSLINEKEMTIKGFDCINSSFPEFLNLMKKIKCTSCH